MNAKHLLFSCLAVLGTLTGCLSEPDFEPGMEGGIEINLEGVIDQVATKVTADGFEHGDAVGMYAVNYENGNKTPGVLKVEGNQADHVKYIFDQNNWKWTPVKKVYYKDINTCVDLYLFSPYTVPDDINEFKFEVQKDQSKPRTITGLGGYESSDFLWAKVNKVEPSENAVRAVLNHKMAGVQVVLKQGTGFEEGEFGVLDKFVLVTGTTRKASIDLTTGKVSPIGAAQSTGIVMCPQDDGSFRAVVVPQTVAANIPLFSITFDGIVYQFKTDKAISYTVSSIKKFTITVNRKGHKGDYEFVASEPEILPWTEDLNAYEGTARQYYCVNVQEPGTLGRIIKADGKNPMKIKNLKVSGTITDKDFFFMRDSMAILEAVNLKESRVVNVKCSTLTLEGHKDDYGKSTVFATREAGTYDDVIPDEAFKNKKSLYYFTFPEKVVEIGRDAFNGSSVSAALVIPDDVKHIWSSAFQGTNISSVIFAPGVEIIAPSSFSSCNGLAGTLSLPANLKYIGSSAFSSCGLSGTLVFPNNLEYIGARAFNSAGDFVGSLHIPDKVSVLYECTFDGGGGFVSYVPFTGTLNLNNVTKLGAACFSGCNFSGELVIPEGVSIIPEKAFWGNGDAGKFTSVIFPSTLKIIETAAFLGQDRLCENLIFPEGMIAIKTSAFDQCSNITGLSLPSTLQSIQGEAFNGCYGINAIKCTADEPPVVISGAFNGVPKDNFTVEVPARSVNRYATDQMWSEFRRISAHYDFSIRRNLARALNAKTSKKYVLSVPSGNAWSIKNKPEWITVTPSSGVGKTEVTVTFSEMSAAEAGQIKVTMTHPTYAYQTTQKTLKGRAGEIVFQLDGKDYTTSMAVEQFDYAYGDGKVMELNRATKGNGVNIVLLGDCYDAADIAAGNYLADLQTARDHFFDIEPYKTYKEYFNVYAVVGVSDDSGMGTLNTIKDSKFGSTFGEKNLVQPDMDACFEYACKAPINGNVAQTLVVLVENTTSYGGVCYMYGDGSAVACCPKSADAYPYDFRGIVQHEAGGHGFAKLADEYIYHNAFISTCTCTDGCGHTQELQRGKAKGWYRNVELTGDMNEVAWSHFIFHPKYSDQVDIYEGGYFHTRGVYRSEPTSCMNNNIPYYSAISRQTMVERIMEYAGETFDLDAFIAKDVTKATQAVKGFDIMPVQTYYDNGKQHAPVYMGDKPNFRK